jgi:hypothetical protein
LAITWIFGSFWSIIPFFSKNQFVIEGFKTSCSFDFIDQSLFNRIMIISANIFGFIIPVFIIILCYIFIILYFKKHNKSINESNLVESEANSSSNSQESNTDKPSNDASNKQPNSESFLMKIIYDSIASIPVIRLDLDKSKLSISEMSTLNRQSDNNASEVNIPLKLRFRNILTEKKKRKILKKELDVTKNIILIIIAFCLAWLLFFFI